jgi:hypothetical protein
LANFIFGPPFKAQARPAAKKNSMDRHEMRMSAPLFAA